MRIAAASIVDPRTKLWSQNLEDTRLGLLCQKKKRLRGFRQRVRLLYQRASGGGGGWTNLDVLRLVSGLSIYVWEMEGIK